MRVVLFMLGISVGILCIGNRAEAQNYSRCSYYRSLGGENCGLTTSQQCLDNVSRIGGFCEPNTQYRAVSVE